PGALPPVVRGRMRSRARAGPGPVHPPDFLPRKEDSVMNDIRRSILWVVFGFSLIMIWDKWQIHNGKQPTFFPSAAVTEQAPASSGAAPANADVPTASGATGGAVAGTPATDAAPVLAAQRHE